MDILELKQQAKHSIPKICMELFPEGRNEGGCWKVGSLDGERGRSMSIFMHGEDAGKWTDFATGDHGDVIDLVQASQRLSLNDAMDWVKRHCNIRDIDRSKKLKTAGKKYRTPKLPKQDPTSPNLHAYLEGRGFQDVGEMVGKWRVYEAEGKIIHPFYDQDGNLSCIKSKHMETRKQLTEGNKAGESKMILYGWHVIPENTRVLWLVEGELDAMALNELGFAAMSVPTGASGLGYLAHEYDNLDRFEDIVLAFDQDEKGDAGAAKHASRFGDRAFRVTWEGGKDANEILKTFGYDKAKLIFEKAYDSCKWKDPDQLRSVLDFVPDINSYFDQEQSAQGWRSGWEKVDDKDLRFLGLWGITGINGHGKSMWLGQLMLNLMKQGAKPLVASMEMTPKYLLGRLMKQSAGSARPPEDYRNAILNWWSENLWLFVDRLTPKPDQLMKTFEYAYKRYGCDVFVIDSLTNMVRQDDYPEQQKFVELLVNFKLKYNVTIFLVTHSRKGESEFMAPNKFDVKGSGSITDLADGFMSVWKNKKKIDHLETCAILGKEPDEEIVKGWDFYLHVLKNRNGMYEGQLGFEFDPQSNQYLEKRGTSPRYYINYSKDKTQ